jgi:hypothetical protein
MTSLGFGTWKNHLKPNQADGRYYFSAKYFFSKSNV